MGYDNNLWKLHLLAFHENNLNLLTAKISLFTNFVVL